MKLPKLITNSKYEELLEIIEQQSDNMDKIITYVENFKTVIDGLLLNDAQHSQIESNLTRIINEIRNPVKTPTSMKAENEDTKKSYL